MYGTTVRSYHIYALLHCNNVRLAEACREAWKHRHLASLWVQLVNPRWEARPLAVSRESVGWLTEYTSRNAGHKAGRLGSVGGGGKGRRVVA